MACGLTTGRKEPCLDSVGGIKRIHLFEYVDYAYNQIVGVKGSTLTSFPASTLYAYDCVLATFDENINNSDDGISVDQTLVFTLTKQDLTTTRELEILEKIDIRFVVEYNDGKFKVGGLFKGASMEELKLLSGGAKNELNGYQITIKAEEEYQAAFIDDLTIFDGGAVFNLLLETGDNLLLETGDNLLLE